MLITRNVIPIFVNCSGHLLGVFLYSLLGGGRFSHFIGRTLRGKVVFDDPVHHISGKISKKYRTCYNYKRVNGLKFTSVHGDRVVPATAEELARREKFRIVRLAARDRSMTPTTLNADQLAYKRARNAGDQHSTFKGWLFYKGWQYYDAGTNTVVWPTAL